MKATGIAIAVVIGIILLGLIGLGFRYVIAPFSGAVQQQEIMESGGSRVYNYNRFFRLCSNVQTYEDQLDSQRVLLETTDRDDRDHLSMIRRNISGLEARRADAINTYNAEARAIGTGGRFRDDSLPFEISRNPYDGTNKTRCN